MTPAKQVISYAVGYFEGADPDRDDKCADYIIERLKLAGYEITAERKDAEIAKLKWQVSGEMENCAKLRALLRDTLAVAEAFKGRSDKEPILRRAREALDEQLPPDFYDPPAERDFVEIKPNDK